MSTPIGMLTFLTFTLLSLILLFALFNEIVLFVSFDINIADQKHITIWISCYFTMSISFDILISAVFLLKAKCLSKLTIFQLSRFHRHVTIAISHLNTFDILTKR